MKKMVLLLLVLTLTGGLIPAQKLIDIYKNGTVKLVADKTYGANNNWESLFNLYYDTLGTYDRPRGNDKKIVVAPDGSVFMSHKNMHEIWKFGPDGNFVKSFGSKGGKPHQFPMLPSIEPVVDGKYIFTCDVNARLKFFDLNGNYFKSLTLDYMTGGFQPIGDGIVMLEGRVMWKNEDPGTKNIIYKWRHIIVKLNINTGEEKIIYDFFEPANMKVINPSDKATSRMESIPPPDGNIYLPNYLVFNIPVFVLLKSGQFLQFDRKTGEVRYINADGKEIQRFKLDISPIKITEKDVLENYESTKQSLIKSINYAKLVRDSTRISKGERGTTPGTVISAFPNSDEIIKKGEEALTKIESLKDINKYYTNLPYFSNIIVDEEGNLLVFEFTSKEERESNAFNLVAYNANGKILARTSFTCDEYDLDFSGGKFIISKGYVYAVAKLKNTTGMPLRLVKFKMTN
jgi:hypothetical protein